MARKKTREPLIQLDPERYDEAIACAAELELVEGMLVEACAAGVSEEQCEATRRGLEFSRDQIRRKCSVFFPDRPNPIKPPPKE